jgi:hypothetical protein
MLKKAAALLLSVLYLVTATGFALNVRFCGDAITTISINTTAKTPAGCVGGMKCCANKHLVIKVKEAHIAEAHGLLAKIPVITAAQFVQPYFSFSFGPALSEAFNCKRPPDPPLPGIDVFLKNRVFRI